MATLQITQKLSITPLIEVQSPTFAECYVIGVRWRLFGWHEHGEVEAQGPLPEQYLINNLTMYAQAHPFDGQHHASLRSNLGFFVGMLHGGVLTPTGTVRPDATTLVVLHTEDFREGYMRGRRDYFTQYEEISHTEDDLLEVLTWYAQDDLYLGDQESTLHWAMGCIVGELSGRLFPMTEQERLHEYALSPVEQATMLQEA